MADFFTQTARLVPYAKRPRGATGYVTVFSDEPRTDDPAFGLGSFYAVIEVISGGREAEEAVQITLETAQQTYYAQDGPAAVLDRFEAATKAVNHALTDYVNRGNAGWVGKMSGVLAVLNGQELHVAYTGSAEAFLYRGPHATRITVQPHNRIQQPSKIFGSIASGQLEIGDKLLLATPALVHHLSLGSLKTTIGENNPGSAVAKITQQLDGQAADRIAALILELSTPELASQSMPAETAVQTAPRPSMLEGARTAATPLIGEAAGRSAELAGKARQAAAAHLPQAKRLGWQAAGKARTLLQNRRYRLAAGAAAALAIILIAWGLSSHGTAASNSQASAQINQLISEANSDQQKVIDEDSSVRPDLLKLQSELKRLNTKANQGAWKSAGTDPATLAAQIQSDIDQLDHVISIAPTKLAGLAKAGHPTLLSIADGLAVAVDPGKGSITTVDVHSGTVRSSNNRLTGRVVWSAPSSAGDGVYFLTDQPAVYLYKPLADSLTQVGGGWDKGSAIASYAGNLYELSNGVSKRVPTLTGYSAPSVSLPQSAQGLSGATSLAVDGAIYVAGPSGIYRYVAGSLTGQLPTPAGLKSVSSLSPGNGDYILAVDTSAGRLALLASQSSGLGVNAEYAVTNLKAAALDVSTGKIYAISGTDLVSFSLPR